MTRYFEIFSCGHTENLRVLFSSDDNDSEFECLQKKWNKWNKILKVKCNGRVTKLEFITFYVKLYVKKITRNLLVIHFGMKMSFS